MTGARFITAVTATLALLGAAGAVHAQSVRGQAILVTDNLTGVTLDQGQWGPQPVHHSLEFNADKKNRIILKLDMSQPVGRDMQFRDVQAGAYYRLTPSLRIGGAVSLGDAPAVPDRSNLPQTQAPRVRFETNFKF
ncbi:MAG TPA: hypothetical protein VHZ26_05730 [Caulobacteraceae bacterium]|jgi:hypothetical protein|nr:hypothetical protein [Caulobacteraceae bacterium]